MAPKGSEGGVLNEIFSLSKRRCGVGGREGGMIVVQILKKSLIKMFTWISAIKTKLRVKGLWVPSISALKGEGPGGNRVSCKLLGAIWAVLRQLSVIFYLSVPPMLRQSNFNYKKWCKQHIRDPDAVGWCWSYYACTDCSGREEG